MTTARERFIERFGQDQAVAIEAAANEHRFTLLEGTDHGQDSFRDALVICIGHECMTRFADYHGIDVDQEQVREWVLEQGDWFGDHDGPIDYLAMFAGWYDDWLPQTASEQDREGASE